MQTTMAMNIRKSVGESLAFLAFPAKRSAEQVSGTTEQLVEMISVLVSRILTDVISSRTAPEFSALRTKYLHRYMQIMVGMGELINASVDEQVIERLTGESLSEMESDFRHEGHVFGEVIRDQASFTVWTLRKINDLVRDCNQNRVARDLLETDRTFAREYVSNVLYAKFHLDCLRMALTSETPIFPEPLREISDGLRATVDAYAWVKQGRDLRHPSAEEEVTEIPWDDEQQELLELSTNELLREVY